MDILYFNLDALGVTTDSSHIYSEESFFPTVNIGEGWVLVYQYNTYDSLGEDKEVSTCVVDMYPTKEDADAQARILMEYAKTGSKYDLSNPIKYANGKKVQYLAFLGWGSRFKKCFIKKVQVKELDYVEYKGY